jgi:diguanylate cyclase (GGDEF)-like protein/PAS domain S-box-containing protein
MTESNPALRILYVEDDPKDVELTRQTFARKAPDLLLDSVGTVAGAIGRLTDGAAFDAILIDLRLPDGSGLDLLTEIRERNLPLAIVALTGSGDQDAALAVLKAGADDYLVKRDGYLDRLPGILAAAISSFAGSERRPRPLRILYAEHKEFDLDLTRRHLARFAPYIRLDSVRSGEEVLARLPASAAAEPPYDVVLLDYLLPGANGLEISRVLRYQHGLDLPVVLVTGQGSEELVSKAMRLEVADYLVKHDGYLAKLPAVLEKVHQKALVRREQAHLRKLTERHNHVLSASPTIIYTLRVEGKRLIVTWVSENVTRVMGYSREECLQPNWWKSNLCPDDRNWVLGNAPRIFIEDRLVMEYRFHDRAGVLRWVHDESRLLRDDCGVPVEVVGSWNEISAERQAEERLRLYGAALASSRDAVIITDLSPRILAVNPAFTQITGYSEAEVLGQNPRILSSGRQDAAFYKALWTSLVEAGYWQGEMWNRRKNGEMYPEWFSINTVRNERGEATHYVGVATDLSQLKHSEDKLQHLAHFDPLTELPNRALLELRLEHAIERARRHEYEVGVLLVDQDRFKTINDSLGHEAGDALLLAIAERLGSRLRTEDTLARPRGDQFVLVMETVHDYLDCERMARQLLEVLDPPFALPGGHDTYVKASIGIAVFPQDGETAHALLDKASIAVHRAKELGGHQFCYYTGELNALALQALEMESALRGGLERNEFILYYQPKVDLGSGRIAGAEALLRWQRPGHGMVSPLQFIPVAESSGLIVEIGAWVIGEACRQMRSWLDEGLTDCSLAVNVSARQFLGRDLEKTIADALHRHAIEPRRLMLELTESMLMQNPETAVARLTALKTLGVRLSLDDFGTGYSSLSYLSRFPIDQLKIDRSFVTDIVFEPTSAIIATSVIALAHRMGLEVVAEGVETEAQLGYLRKNHCDKMQGYYFSKPVPPEEFSEQLRQGKSLPAFVQAPEARTLLIVDDEPHILAAIRRLLRGEGYRIFTAGSASEGLDILAKNPVQVILSDQRMPEMNGTEFLGRVKVLHPETVRLVLSGYTELESIMKAVNAGALYKFLTKPWDDEALREHIRDAFRYYDSIILPHGGSAERKQER